MKNYIRISIAVVFAFVVALVAFKWFSGPGPSLGNTLLLSEAEAKKVRRIEQQVRDSLYSQQQAAEHFQVLLKQIQAAHNCKDCSIDFQSLTLVRPTTDAK